MRIFNPVLMNNYHYNFKIIFKNRSLMRGIECLQYIVKLMRYRNFFFNLKSPKHREIDELP